MYMSLVLRKIQIPNMYPIQNCAKLMTKNECFFVVVFLCFLNLLLFMFLVMERKKRNEKKYEVAIHLALTHCLKKNKFYVLCN